MSGLLSQVDFGVIRRRVREFSGLTFEDDKCSAVSKAVCARMDELGLEAPDDYLKLVDAGASTEEIAALTARLTIGETYFFRNKNHWRAFDEYVVPTILEHNRSNGRRRVRVWSAACSTGEEAYTAGIALRERVAGLDGEGVEIIGTDINPESVAKARTAVYTANSFRGVPDGIRQRHFEEVAPQRYRVKDGVRSLATFRLLNLLAEGEMASMRGFDVVFCRNVLIYFDKRTARAVLGSLRRSLRPGGFLFLGHAENLHGTASELQCREVCGTFIYMRASDESAGRHDDPSETLLGEDENASRGRYVQPASPGSDSAAAATARVSGGDIIDIPSPAGPPVPNDASSTASATDHEAESLDRLGARAIECLCSGLNVDARKWLEEVLAQRPDDVTCRLGMALLLAGCGDSDAALHYCNSVLQDDPLSAEARCVTALVHEGLGSYEVARRELEKAIYLDSRFSVAYFRLALLHERMGSREAGDRALRSAIATLGDDDDQRVRLYSGGYGKEAIEQICQRRLGELALTAPSPQGRGG